MEILVAQPKTPSVPPLPVGLVRWSGPWPMLSIVVKATLSIPRGAGGAELEAFFAPDQQPLSLDRGEGDLPGEVTCPSDFVPRKQQSDVILSGSAYSAEPTTRLRVRWDGAGIVRAACVASPQPTTRAPLRTRALRTEDGSIAAERVGAMRARREPGSAVVAGEADFNAAPPPQRGRAIPTGAVLRLEGLLPGGGVRVVRLPALAPRVLVETRTGTRPLRMLCDTLVLDTDRLEVVLVWRGALEVESLERPGVQRVVVALEPRDGARSDARLRAHLTRGHFGWAVEERHLLAGGDPPAMPPEELSLARYGAWDAAAEPALPVDRYAGVAAELAEGRAPREEVLARHRLDEHDWALEERAWAEQMANDAAAGDGTLAVRFGEHFVRAQDALATPPEAARSAADYAALRAAMEATGDPAAVLREAGLSLAAWMRLERRFGLEAARPGAFAGTGGPVGGEG